MFALQFRIFYVGICVVLATFPVPAQAQRYSSLPPGYKVLPNAFSGQLPPGTCMFDRMQGGYWCTLKPPTINLHVGKTCRTGYHPEGGRCIRDGHKSCRGQQRSCEKEFKCIPGGCAPQNASACPSGKGRYCNAPKICDKGLDGKEACYTKEAHARLTVEKEKRELAKLKKGQKDRDRKADYEFAKTHGGISYKGWLARQRQAVGQGFASVSPVEQCQTWASICASARMDCDKKFTALGYTPNCVKRTGVPISEWMRRTEQQDQTNERLANRSSYLDKMVDEAEADLAAHLQRLRTNDPARAEAIADFARQFSEGLTNGVRSAPANSFQRIQEIANSNATAKNRHTTSASAPTQSPKANPPCETNGNNGLGNGLVCESQNRTPNIAESQTRNGKLETKGTEDKKAKTSWLQDWTAGAPDNKNVTGFQPNKIASESDISLSEQILPFDRQKAANDLEILELSQRVYHSPYSEEGVPPQGWNAIPGSEKRDSKTGFKAAAYRRQTDGKVVVAIAGTDCSLGKALTSNCWNDVDDDAAAGVGRIPVQFDQARNYIKDIRKKYGSNIECTGHSLGGGACAFAAASLPAGVHATVLNPITPGYLVTKPTKRVDNYVIRGDLARKWYGERFDHGLLGNVYMVEEPSLKAGALERHGTDRALENIASQANVARSGQ